MNEYDQLHVPKFPKRWSREKRKAARRKYIAGWHYRRVMLKCVPYFINMLNDTDDYLASLPSPYRPYMLPTEGSLIEVD